MKTVRSFFKKTKNSLSSPEERLQDVIRELNEKIPELNSGIAALRTEMVTREKELNDLIAREEKLIRTIRGKKKTEKKKPARRVTGDLQAIQQEITTASAEVDELKETYFTAIDTMKSWLFTRKEEMDRALAGLKKQNRQEWHHRCEKILAQCQALSSAEVSPRAAREGNGSILIERIDEGAGKLKAVSRKVSLIADEAVRQKINDILSTSRSMLDHLRENPENATKARMFLLYYLDSVIEIIEGYLSLSKQELETEKITEALQRAEKLIEEIQQAFKNLHEKLLESEVLHLDTEMKVLEKALGLE